MTTYDVRPTEQPLTGSDLYVGRTVCFIGVTENPNLVGVLVRSTDNSLHGVWSATINNTKYIFNKLGQCLNIPQDAVNNAVESDGEEEVQEGTEEASSSIADAYRLYGVITSVDLNINTANAITRGDGESAVTTTLSSLIPKDQFAICAMQSLISSMPNAIAMDDATILLIATKSYKISQAMLYVGTLARNADAASSESSDAAPVDAANLSDNTEKILYNINETLKAIKTQDASQHTEGLKISSVSPTLKIDNPTDDKLEIEGGGGGTSITRDSLNDTFSPTDVVSFNSVSGNNPMRTTIVELMKAIESAQKNGLNGSAIAWILQNNITDISGFLDEYAQDIYGNQKINWRTEIKRALVDALAELCQDNPSLDNTVVQSTISIDVEDDSSWNNWNNGQ